MDRKLIVKDFIERCALGKSTSAFADYVSPDFVHHNPWFKSDAQTLAQAMKESADDNPQTSITVHRILEEGETLMTHSEVRHAHDQPPIACAHIYRFDEDNKIAELWDIAMPEPADAVNEKGLF